jgi:phosphoribosylformimino-5-aminoimidazole carboxamide ribotide isomerase
VDAGDRERDDLRGAAPTRLDEGVEDDVDGRAGDGAEGGRRAVGVLEQDPVAAAGGEAQVRQGGHLPARAASVAASYAARRPAMVQTAPVRFDVLPAIDLAGGRVVRLVQGRFEHVTDYGDDPLATARDFLRGGSRSLHVVDLDAARTGVRPPEHRALLERLAEERPAGGVLQAGGGLRDAAAIEETLALGVDRVLVGTLAFRAPDVVADLALRHGARVCVTADVLDGSVRVAGWAEDAGVGATAAVADLAARGVGAFLVTAIERDGTLTGPDLRLLARVRAAAPDAILVASGGIATAADIAAVRDTGCDAVVVGRALYAGTITLADALAAAS